MTKVVAKANYSHNLPCVAKNPNMGLIANNLFNFSSFFMILIISLAYSIKYANLVFELVLSTVSWKSILAYLGRLQIGNLGKYTVYNLLSLKKSILQVFVLKNLIAFLVAAFYFFFSNKIYSYLIYSSDFIWSLILFIRFPPKLAISPNNFPLNKAYKPSLSSLSSLKNSFNTSLISESS